MAIPLLSRDVMVTRLVTLSPQSEVLHSIRTLMKRRVTGAPVVGRGGDYQGVFSERSCLSVATQLLGRTMSQSDRFPKADRIMAQKLITLAPDDDVMDAIGRLLKYRVSGVPVMGRQSEFQGVFSEKTSMNVVLQSAFDQVPGGPVRSFVDSDAGRKVDAETSLLSIIDKFLSMPYRRLVVTRGDRLIGLISRRDAIRAAMTVIDKLGISSGDAGRVEQFTQDDARTIAPDLDLLSVAQIFQQTNFRRLPILEKGTLLGQLSRRDVLAAFHRALAPPKTKEPLLYLSSLHRREDSPIT